MQRQNGISPSKIINAPEMPEPLASVTAAGSPRTAPASMPSAKWTNSTASWGVLLVEPLPDDVAGWLAGVQHDLFDLGGELAVPGYVAIVDAHILRLEEMTRLMNAPCR